MTADTGTSPKTDFTMPPGWIHRLPADDLDLAVLLVNSMDLLEDPPDRLTSVQWYRDALRTAGHADIAEGLHERDLDGLKELRALLRLLFSADTLEEAVEIVNPMLVRGAAVPQLVVDEDGCPGLQVAPTATGLEALAARLPAAAAELIAESELRRLGTCAGTPCECAFVDRSRSGSRRFCSDWCNDRAAAAAYRARRKAGL
ncbi:CGNR zinc finger domain-containing protein [Catenulispora subtropica]|uniref:CGNR zinc finger domain-containing protein n=1 Tax=Catenulispora subtropica TaxID=450798 RepID=A0ABP5DLM4_9ACTN